MLMRLAAFFVIATTATAATAAHRHVTEEDLERGFVLARIGENKCYDLSMRGNPVICADWRAFGAMEDWIYISLTNWTFRIGSNEVDRVRVFSSGKVELSTPQFWLAPFETKLGIVPDTICPSHCQFWYSVSPEALLLTWDYVLINRSKREPVSFQVEIFRSGKFVFRYDVSGLYYDSLKGARVGASLGNGQWMFDNISINQEPLIFHLVDRGIDYYADPDGDGIATIDELFDYDSDPALADTDFDGLNDYEEIFIYRTDPSDPYFVSPYVCDGIAARARGADLTSRPYGSSITVFEHVFYAGSVDGAVEYPQSTSETAVLNISMSGDGCGRLIVGDTVVPLLGGWLGRNYVGVLSLMIPVEKGVRKDIWFEASEYMEIYLESDDLMIGDLPTTPGQRGWIAFPHTDATPPCIHDFAGNGKTISLAHGEEFSGLKATWRSDDDGVTITNKPPVSAIVHGKFSKNRTRSISYTVSHPKQLNRSEVRFAQELRFCPQFSDEEMPSVDPDGGVDYGSYNPDLWVCSCGDGGSCICDGKGWCHCLSRYCRCNENKTPTLDEDCKEEAQSFTNIVNGLLSPMEDVLYLYRRNTRTEYLTVPEGLPKKCCPCPEHWASNHVSLTSFTRRVAVKDAVGNDFRISYEPCTVTMTGLSPSSQFGDSTVCFLTNGVTCKQFDYTVLGLKINAPSFPAPVERYNSLSSDFGLPVEVGKEYEFELRTDVNLEGGYVHLALEDVDGDFEIWLSSWYDQKDRRVGAEKLLDGKVMKDRYFSMKEWRGIMKRYYEGNILTVRVRSLSEGSCKLKFEYAASDGTHYVHDIAEQKISSCNPVLLVDYDRDGNIGAADVARRKDGKLAYFWANDDKWKGDDAFATSLSKNSGNKVIDGRNDLINFLPVAVDISTFDSHWGANNVYYRLKSDGEAPSKVNVVFADIDWSEIGDMPLGEDVDMDGTSIYEAPVKPLGDGVTLPARFAQLSQTGRSTLLMEFAEPSALSRLYLTVYSKTDNARLFSASMELKVSDISDMIGWLNLRSAAGGSDGVPTRLDTPGWPARAHGDGNIVFVHGYNMAEDAEVPLWAKNVFKKLWWSGLDKGFIAVQWRGNEGQFYYLPDLVFVTPNYYGNVQNAFATASALADAMRGIEGPKWFLAHSLGNMLVSAAIQDFDMEYEKYFMLNSAVAMEAYDTAYGITDESRNNMTPRSWINYPNRVRSTHWFERFIGDDGRARLTWHWRFYKISDTIIYEQKIVNFYSSQEDVVCNGDGTFKDLGRVYAWYNQETRKGSWPTMLHEQEGGWEFNKFYDTVTYSYDGNELVENRQRMSPREAEKLSDEQLQEHPFFLDFANPQMHTSPYGRIVETNYLYRAEMLAYAIPAESYAVGANPFFTIQNVPYERRDDPIVGNYNMAALFNDGIDDLPPNGTNIKDRHRDWQHSTFVQRSYRRVHRLFKKITQLMERD